MLLFLVSLSHSHVTSNVHLICPIVSKKKNDYQTPDDGWAKFMPKCSPAMSTKQKDIGSKEDQPRDGTTTSIYANAKFTETTTISQTTRRGSPRNNTGLHGKRLCEQQTQATNKTRDPDRLDNGSQTNTSRTNNTHTRVSAHPLPTNRILILMITKTTTKTTKKRLSLTSETQDHVPQQEQAHFRSGARLAQENLDNFFLDGASNSTNRE